MTTNVSQAVVAVNPRVRSVDLAVSAADFTAFCVALRCEFPEWGDTVQIMRKATHGGPVARVAGLRGHTFSASDVAMIRTIAAEYPAVATEVPAPITMAQPIVVVNWPQGSRRRSSMKFGRATTWAGVR